MANTNTFYLAPGEEFTNCPYSMAHRITNVKELTHVTKCRANYLKECKEKGEKPDMVSCRFVFSHQIPAIEREYHEERCPGSGRYSVASHIAYQGTEEFREKIKQERPDKLSDVSSDEAPVKESKKSHKNKTEKNNTQVKIKEEPVDDSLPRNHDRFGRDAKRSAKSSRSRSPSRDRSRSRDRRGRSRDRDRRHDRDRSRGSRDRKSHRDRSRDRRRSRSRSRDRGRRRSYSRRSSSSPEYERVSKKQKHSSKKKAPTPPLLTTADLGDENWDEDCKEGYEPGYDPKVKLEADCILYNPMGLKKSERKKFRLENRKKAKIDVEEIPAVEPNHIPSNSSSIDIKPPINNYKPAPTYPPEEEEDVPYAGPAPGPRYRPPHPYPSYGPGPGFPPHGYGPPPPHMMPGYGPPHPHMGPGPGFYGPPMGMGPPGYGPHPMMYGRPPMGPPHPHYGPLPGMYPHYGRPPMVPPPYDPHPPMRPVYDVERVERGYSPPSPRRYSPPSPRRYSSPSPQRDVKPNIKDISSLPEVTAPALVKRDPDEPYEEGEIDEEGAKNDVKPSQTEDYDWNDDDD